MSEKITILFKWIIIMSALVLLGLAFYLGYRSYPRLHPTVIESDTILTYDSFPYIIHDTIPQWETDSIMYRDQAWMDSVLNSFKVDTAEILRNYYSYFHYQKEWRDTNFVATLNYGITENKPIYEDFVYKILRPQQVINNIINNYFYSRYLYIGLSVPIKDLKYAEIEGLFAFKKGYLGLSYGPHIKSVNIKGGISLFKFK